MGVGEHGGGRAGHRHAHHHHNHHRNHHHHHGRIHHGPRLTLGGGNRGGSAVAGTSGYCSLTSLTMLLIFGFIVGMTMANVGRWLASALGIAGIAILIIIFIVVIVVINVVIFRCHKQKLSRQPAGGEEAGNMNPNMTVSTETLEGGSTTAAQVGETTSYIIQPGAMQPGGVAMGTQPGYPEVPAQPYSLAARNLLGAPWYPPFMLSDSNLLAAASMPYPQPGAASPVNYTAPYPAQPSSDSHVGVVNPTSQGNDIVPPPSYNDVMSGNVKYNEGQEVNPEMNPEMNPEVDQLS